MNKVNIQEKLDKIIDHWHPGIVSELNGQHIKLVKFQGEFIWHKHDNEDEMFMVIEGSFDMHFRDKIVTLHKNELLVVPRGVEHKPVASSEVSVMLFEPASTINTGGEINHLTKIELEVL